jgi:SPOR domain
MADDQTQRPYRLNEPPVRRTPAVTSTSGSDPLAELARLIGQTDPFGEFGRDNARRATTPLPASATPPATVKFGADDYFGATTAPAAHPPLPEARAYAAPGAARQSFADTENFFHDQPETQGRPAAETDGHAPDAYPQSNLHLAGEEVDLYEDGPAPKRRMGVMAIAAVFALAVIGTAGAFGYRAMFGSSGPSQPPPVINADTAPSKIVPVTASKTPSKLITDRVADHEKDEKLVSREEQPVEMKPAAAPPPPQTQGSAPRAAPQAALDSGVISSEPKKVHTIAIRPDQPTAADNQPVTAPAATPAPAPVKQAPPPQVASNPPAVASPSPAPPARPVDARAAAPAAPVHQAQASASRNAPLSLSPDAPAAPAARAPARTASVAEPATATAAQAAGTYAVQVSSQRSEADAQASFHSLQAKYPNQLGGRQASIHKVELGAKGTYYRAMVGPFATANEASTLCSGLKAAGGACIVQRN